MIKKLLGIVVLSLLFSSNTHSLNNCLGDDPKSWTNCIGSFNYPDKKYTGEWVNGKREGQGISNLNDGSSYEGEWKNDLPNGQGTMKIPYNGYRVKFFGKWKDGQPNGQGILECYPQGLKRTGNWDKKKFDGKWIDGSLTIINDDGSETYVGAESCGIYKGEVKNNLPHGKGEFIWPDGSKVFGNWKNDDLVEGTRIFYNGTKYTGEFKDSLPNGKGTFLNSDGSKIEGQFKNGYPKNATQTFPDGTKYTGKWKDNVPHGQGTFTTKEGVIYAGEWENDKLNGEVTITYPEGKTVKGIFKDGKFIKEIKDL